MTRKRRWMQTATRLAAQEAVRMPWTRKGAVSTVAAKPAIRPTPGDSRHA